MGMPKPYFAATSASLPDPDQDAAALSRRLCELIRAEIERHHGRISFARFMELALYAPGLGYYVAGSRKFGEAGDFVTAPELGDLFAQCIARQCAQILAATGGRVLEFGAGSGALAAEVLKTLDRLGRFPERYQIVELSPELRQRQHALLQHSVPQLLSRVEWLDALPPEATGVILANEVADAMPVKRFRVEADRITEIGVAWSDDGFTETEMPAQQADVDFIDRLNLPPGYICELHDHARAWLASVAEILTAGVVLVIDYGFPRSEYYHPQRTEGTLMCHYRHRAHGDPYRLVGLQDITAHLDFSALSQCAQQSGLTVYGYTQQAAFLMSLGLLDLIPQEPSLPAAERLGLNQQIRKLTLPSEMGELFKVLAVGRGCDFPLQGFSMRDHRDRL